MCPVLRSQSVYTAIIDCTSDRAMTQAHVILCFLRAKYRIFFIIALEILTATSCAPSIIICFNSY